MVVDATIGGFNITDGSLYSGVKQSADNSTLGVYMYSDAQFAIGDNNNYLKFYKYADNYVRTDEVIEALDGIALEGIVTTDGDAVYSYTYSDGNTAYYTIVDNVGYRVSLENAYRLDISAASVLLSRSHQSIETAFEDINNKVDENLDTMSQEIETQKNDYYSFKTDFFKYISFMTDEINYIKTTNIITPNEEGTIVSGVETITKNPVYSYTDDDGNAAYYTVVDGVFYAVKTSNPAVVIGSGDSTITLEIDNEAGIIFKKNGVQFGWWDGVEFHTGNIVVEVNERAQFGNFAYIPRSDGSLSFLKVGG